MMRVTALLIGLGVAAGVGLGAYALWPAAQPPRTSASSATASSNAVVARGRIEPASRVRTLQGQSGSVIERLYVREGDRVEAGAVIAHTNARPALAAALSVEERRLAEAEQTLAQIQAPAKASDIETQHALVRQRDVEWRQARTDFERTRALVGRGVAASEQEQTRRTQMDQARHALDQAEWRLRSLSEHRGIDAVVAATRVDTQRALVEKARADLDRSEIRSPIAGTVLMVMVREGEALEAEGLLQIGDLSRLMVIAEVGETAIGRVRVGQSVTMSGPMLSGTVNGRVERIASTVFRQRRPSSDVLIGRDARVIEVEIVPTDPMPPVVWSEMTVRIAATAP